MATHGVRCICSHLHFEHRACFQSRVIAATKQLSIFLLPLMPSWFDSQGPGTVCASSSFDAENDVKVLRKAMKGLGKLARSTWPLFEAVIGGFIGLVRSSVNACVVTATFESWCVGLTNDRAAHDLIQFLYRYTGWAKHAGFIEITFSITLHG